MMKPAQATLNLILNLTPSANHRIRNMDRCRTRSFTKETMVSLYSFKWCTRLLSGQSVQLWDHIFPIIYWRPYVPTRAPTRFSSCFSRQASFSASSGICPSAIATLSLYNSSSIIIRQPGDRRQDGGTSCTSALRLHGCE